MVFVNPRPIGFIERFLQLLTAQLARQHLFNEAHPLVWRDEATQLVCQRFGKIQVHSFADFRQGASFYSVSLHCNFTLLPDKLHLDVYIKLQYYDAARHIASRPIEESA